MALQGTLETFSVPEVLRLLSGTNKTGLLAIDGDRGSGKVWLGEGSIISARSDHESNGDIDATLFDLLRFDVGDFVFESDTTPDHPVSVEVDVDTALERAETLLEEWRDLETVVPSLLLGVRLVRQLDAESVTVTAQQWRSLAAIGGGMSAAGLGQRLELGELDTCRRIRDLVDASLIELTDEDIAEDPAPVVPASTESIVDRPDHADGYEDEPQLIDHDLSRDEVATLGSNLASFVARPDDADDEQPGVEESAGDAPVIGNTWAEDVDIAHESDPNVTDPNVPGETGGEPETVTDVDSGDADDFLAQLTNLSPKAAAAIEATAEEAATNGEAATGVDHVEAAAEGDEEINRNLLLKFLSTTKN